MHLMVSSCELETCDSACDYCSKEIIEFQLEIITQVVEHPEGW